MAEETVRIVFLGESASAVGATRNLEGALVGLKETAAGIAKSLIAVFAAQKITEFVINAVRGASRLQKSTEAIRAEFGKASQSVLEFSDSAAKIGLSAEDAEKAAAQLGLVAKNLGIGEKPAADMAVNLGKLAGALGEIKGKDPGPIFDSLIKGIQGNTRGLKELGIVLDSHQIKQEALRLGLIKTGEALTPGARALAIYALETKNLGELQAQAAQHSGDLANSQHTLAAEWSNLSDWLGGVLLPAFAKLAAFLAEEIPQAIDAVRQAFAGMRDDLDTIIGGLESLWKTFGSTIKEVAQNELSATINIIRDAFRIIADIFRVVGDLIHGRWQKLWGDLRKLVSDTMDLIANLLRATAGTLLILARNAAQAVWNGFTNVLGKLGAWFAGVIQGIGRTLGSVAGMFKAAFVTGPIDAVKKALDAVWAILQKIVGLAGKVISLVVKVTVDIIGAVTSTLKSFLPGFAEGGVVPGPMGAGQLALVHGGEVVLTPGQQAALGGAAIRGALNINVPTAGMSAAATGGFTGGFSSPAIMEPHTVTVLLSGGLTEQAIDAKISGASERMVVRVGRDADRRAKEGRF